MLKSLLISFEIVIFYLQEYLAAKFVVNQCDLNYFKVFIKTFVFSQNDNTVMFWSTLRRFICTLLANGSKFNNIKKIKTQINNIIAFKKDVVVF